MENNINDDLPLVSVIVITFNHENLLSDCLNSILNQKYKNIEILIGDDASTDKTKNLIEL